MKQFLGPIMKNVHIYLTVNQKISKLDLEPKINHQVRVIIGGAMKREENKKGKEQNLE